MENQKLPENHKTPEEIALATSVLNHWKNLYENFESLDKPYFQEQLKKIEDALSEVRKGIFTIATTGNSIVIENGEWHLAKNKLSPFEKEILAEIK